MFQERKAPLGLRVVQDQLVMLDLWGQRAALDLKDVWGQWETRGLRVKKVLLGLMVYRVYQVYKGLQDPRGHRAAMELMEKMDFLVHPGPLVLMEIQVHQVFLDLRVNPGCQRTHDQGHLDRLGGMVTQGIGVSVGTLDHKANLGQGVLMGGLDPQGLWGLRVKKA